MNHFAFYSQRLATAVTLLYKFNLMRQLKISTSITNRESPSLTKYLLEIGKEKMLSTEEEVYLSERVKKGDRRAIDQLVKANLRFVVSVAKQYQGHGLPLPDLINEGNIGLLTAASRFDHTRGFKFISFAVWWIRQNILQAIGQQSRMIRLPQNKIVLKNQLSKAMASLEQQLDRQPTEDELAEALNADTDDIKEILGHSEYHMSLDAPFSDEEDGSLLDTLENTGSESTDGDLDHRESLKLELSRSLASLNERHQQMLCSYFGIGVDHPMSLEDLGKKYEISTERVRQIRDKALSQLRASKNLNVLRTFLAA